MRSLLVLFAAVCVAGLAPAAAIVSFQQTGPNVTATLSGSLNTTGLSVSSGGTSGFGVIPSAAILFFDFGGFTTNQAYVTIPRSGPTSWGPGGFTNSSSATGDTFLLIENVGGTNSWYFLPNGYVSGAPMNGIMTFNGATIASLGLTPGTYTYAFNTGANADTFTVQVGPAATVPEPATLAVFGAMLVGGGLVARRRLRKAVA